jgi:hypothetical protein
MSIKLLNLTLTPTKNTLDGITLYEPVDVVVLDKLINSTLLNDFSDWEFGEKMYHNEKNQLKKYKDLITDGRAKVNYNRNRGNPYGRSNPDKSLGLFSIRKEIRHTLCKDRFIDIDIDNAHPILPNFRSK